MKKYMGLAAAGIVAGATVLCAQERPRPEIKRPLKDLTPERRAVLEKADFTVVNNPPADVFTITDKVKLADRKPIGTEIPISKMVHWNDVISVNMWNECSSFEPYLFHWYWIAGKNCSGTENSLYDDAAGFWGLYPDGFFDGGTLYLYRKNDKNYMDLVRKSVIKKFDADESKTKGPGQSNFSPGTFFFEDNGSIVQPQDIFVIEKKFTALPANIAVLATNAQNQHMRGWLNMLGENSQIDNGVQWTLDSSTFAPADGSTTSLKMTLPGGGFKGYGWWGVSSFKGKHFVRFDPEKKYACEVWLKQEGIPGGKVVFNIPPFIRKELEVTGSWKKYEFELPVMPVDKETNPTSCKIGAEGAGTVWVDNMLIYQTDVEKFGYMPSVIEHIKELKPVSLRSMHYSLFSFTAEALISKGFREPTVWNPGGAGGTKTSVGLGLHGFLKACQQVGAEPWINVHIYTEEDCLKLMEYLGGPVTTPYGKRRALDGQEKPWTEVFKNINIELGDEPWLGFFLPFPADLNVAVGNTMFRNMKKSPYYVEGRFQFIGNGYAVHKDSHSYKIAHDGVEFTDVSTVGGYIGGWDGFVVLGSDDKKFFQNQLVYVPMMEEPRFIEAKKMLENSGRLSGQSKNPLRVSAYEFGPGYPLPGGKIDPENERVGKSMALGVATFDRVMLFWEYENRGIQSYYKCRYGNFWASHTALPPHRPHPSWLALCLANAQCLGELMETKAQNVYTIDIPDMLVYKLSDVGSELTEMMQRGRKGVPLVCCSTFRKDKRYAFAVYSRSVDQTRKVTLNVPYMPESKVVIYKLGQGNPRATNLDELQVKVVEETRNDFKNGYTFELPPSSIYVLVNQAR